MSIIRHKIAGVNSPLELRYSVRLVPRTSHARIMCLRKLHLIYLSKPNFARNLMLYLFLAEFSKGFLQTFSGCHTSKPPWLFLRMTVTLILENVLFGIFKFYVTISEKLEERLIILDENDRTPLGSYLRRCNGGEGAKGLQPLQYF